MYGKSAILRRGIQALSLLLFVWLLLSAAWPLAAGILPPDAYLRMDPLVAALVPVVVREWLPRLLPGLAVLGLTLLFGRFFCGYICPMGITLDLGRAVGAFFAGRKKTPEPIPLSPRWRKVKYLVLAAMAGAACVGVNLLFWGSPIALATRFWALVVHPIGLLGGGLALEAVTPLFESLGSASLSYLTVEPRRFTTLYFVGGFFVLLFVLERVRPRFWCRYLCPAGALMGLFSLRPFWRRRVERCVNCETCARQCPAGAIAPGGETTFHSECIVCRNCVDVCRTNGVRFAFSGSSVTRPVRKKTDSGQGEGNQDGPPADREKVPQEASCPHCLPSRRAFLGATAAGVALAAVQYSGTHSLLRIPAHGALWSPELVRPPAALPEPDFLDRCIRCGECMKVCPTNGLQPTWLAAGPEGMFSPVLTPRRGPCETDCNACGQVCPTGAIQPLPLKEKHWAKVGTALVHRERCLAWAENRRCVVCQEVCPYGSVNLVQVDGAAVPVPVVNALRCFGCGFCEQHCPTRVASIVVEPLNALRLEAANYQETGQSMGLELRPGVSQELYEVVPDGQLPPGFMPLEETAPRESGADGGGKVPLPPGFSG